MFPMEDKIGGLMNMLKIIGGIFAAIGGFSITLMFLYSLWTVIRVNFLSFLNPLRDLMALIQLLVFPYFWIALVFVVIGALTYQWGEKIEERRQSNKEKLERLDIDGN